MQFAFGKRCSVFSLCWLSLFVASAALYFCQVSCHCHIRQFLTVLLRSRDSCQHRALQSEAPLMHEPYHRAVNRSWVRASAPCCSFAGVCWSCWLGLPIVAVCSKLLAMPWPRRRHRSKLSLGIKSWNCILWVMLPLPSLFWKGNKPAMKQVFKARNQSRHSKTIHGGMAATSSIHPKGRFTLISTVQVSLARNKSHRLDH